MRTPRVGELIVYWTDKVDVILEISNDYIQTSVSKKKSDACGVSISNVAYCDDFDCWVVVASVRDRRIYFNKYKFGHFCTKYGRRE